MSTEKSALKAPFYEDDWTVLYHGDCRELLPGISADVTLTDPPWKLTAEVVQGCLRAVDLWGEATAVLKTRRLLLWLPVNSDPREFLNPIALPYLRTIYIRRAIPGHYGRVLMDGEMIHALGEWPPSRVGRRVIPGGMAITYVKSDRPDGHPAPRSEKAAHWLLSWWSDPGEVVLDPFAGSGTTLVAARSLRRKSIGIEIEERYCDLAAKRLANAPSPLILEAVG